ncbi:MAG: hypothetical protein ABIK07_19830 [Planctomycetota bacterium]
MDSSILLLGVPASLSGFICFLFFVLPVSLLIGSMVLIAAIGLFNKITVQNKRRSESIPVPSVPEAMGIVLVASLINMAINFVLGFFMGLGGVQSELDIATYMDAIVFQLVAFVITFFVNSTVYSAMLPTTFLRAMGVAFFQILIILMNVLMIVIVVVGIISVFKGM